MTGPALHTVTTHTPTGLVEITRRVNGDHRPDLLDRVDDWLTTTADELDMDPGDLGALVATLLIRRAHDDATYRRVATERGVLAL